MGVNSPLKIIAKQLFIGGLVQHPFLSLKYNKKTGHSAGKFVFINKR